jgi:hypothetical protein
MSPRAVPEPPTAARAHAPEQSPDDAAHGRLSPADAAVVIALVVAVTVLAVVERPVPSVLLGLCAAAGGLLARPAVECLLGRCGGGRR